MSEHEPSSQSSGTPRLVLDHVAFWELWFAQRARHVTETSFFVTMLGYRWGREQSARRYARRHRWFHQEAIR